MMRFGAYSLGRLVGRPKILCFIITFFIVLRRPKILLFNIAFSSFKARKDMMRFGACSLGRLVGRPKAFKMRVEKHIA